MADLDRILREDRAWYDSFQAMNPGKKPCDSGCGKPAIVWFGNTSCATCGDAKCVAIQQREYDAIRSELDE